MTVENCKRCGKIFQKGTHAVCNDCVQSETDECRDAMHYIQENPGVTLEEVSGRFGLKTAEIETLMNKVRSTKGTKTQTAPAGLPSMPAPSSDNTGRCARCGREVEQEDRVGQLCLPCNAYIKHRQEQQAMEVQAAAEQREAAAVIAAEEAECNEDAGAEKRLGPIDGPKQIRYSFKRLNGEYITPE